MFVFKKEKKKGRKIFILLHVTGPTVIMLHMNIFLQQLGRVFLSDNYYVYEQLFLHNNWAKFQWFYKFEQHFIAILRSTCISIIFSQQLGQLQIVT